MCESETPPTLTTHDLYPCQEQGCDICASRPVRVQCETCGGEGRKFRSRYGGNDPDVWDDGPCLACDGKGYVDVESEPVTMDDLDHAG